MADIRLFGIKPPPAKVQAGDSSVDGIVASARVFDNPVDGAWASDRFGHPADLGSAGLPNSNR